MLALQGLCGYRVLHIGDNTIMKLKAEFSGKVHYRRYLVERQIDCYHNRSRLCLSI
jgi:hypothetical protein